MKVYLRSETVLSFAFGLMVMAFTPAATRGGDEEVRQVLSNALKLAIPERAIPLSHSEKGQVVFEGTFQPIDPATRYTVSLERLVLSKDRLKATATVKGPVSVSGRLRLDTAFTNVKGTADIEATLTARASVAVDGLILTITPKVDRVDGKVRFNRVEPDLVEDAEGLVTEIVNDWINDERDRELPRRINQKLSPLKVNLLKLLDMKRGQPLELSPATSQTENPQLAKALRTAVTSWLSQFDQKRPWNNHSESNHSIVVRTPEVRQKIPAVIVDTPAIPAVETVIPEVKVFGKVITPRRRVVITPGRPAERKIITPEREVVIPAQEKKLGERTHVLDGKTWIADSGRLVVDVRELSYRDGGLSVDLSAHGPVRTNQRYEIRGLVSAGLEAGGTVALEAKALLRWNSAADRPEAVVTDINGQVSDLKLGGMGPILDAARAAGNFLTGNEIDRSAQRGINDWFSRNRDHLSDQLGRAINEKLGDLTRQR